MWNWLGGKGQDDGEKVNSEPDETNEGERTDQSDVKVDGDKKDTSSLKDVASNLGGYLFTFANVATKTAVKIKDQVDNKLDETIMADFNKENQRFIIENNKRKIHDAVPPWFGYHEEASLKKQILSLSADERNFLRDPPAGVQFVFEANHMMPIAMATLKEDLELEKMRFKLVPKRVKEERFWKNYFYRVSLIKQSTQLSTMAEMEISRSPHHSSSESLSNKTSVTSIPVHENVDETDGVTLSPTANEFVSDAFEDQEEQGLSEEEKNQMFGGDNQEEASDIIDWEIENELQQELESFELVNESPSTDADGLWEKEIEDILEIN